MRFTIEKAEYIDFFNNVIAPRMTSNNNLNPKLRPRFRKKQYHKNVGRNNSSFNTYGIESQMDLESNKSEIMIPIKRTDDKDAITKSINRFMESGKLINEIIVHIK